MKTIIILTVIGLFGGEKYSYAVKVDSMDKCYDMVSIEMQRKNVTDAVCNKVKWIE